MSDSKPTAVQRWRAKLGTPKLWLVAALLLASCTYFFRLGSLAFTSDEIYHGIAVEAILRSGIPVVPNGSLYLKGALFSYLGVLPSLVAGSTEFGVRSVSAVCVLLTGFLLFDLASLVARNQYAGVVAAIVWLFHPWTVEFARWGRLYSLAALLLVAALRCLVCHDVTRRRSQAWLAVGMLVLGTTVYPFLLWCWLVFTGYALALWAHRRPEHKAKGLTIALGSAALLVATAWLVVAYGNRLSSLASQAGVPLTLFVGSTGQPDSLRVEQFIGFSSVYPGFFVTNLPVFAVSLAVLLVWTIVDPGPAPARRVNLAIVAIALGGLLLISFVHLQSGALRYLFPIFPISVLGSVIVWQRLLRLLGLDHARVAYALVLGGSAVAHIAGGAFAPPFRRYGDAYANPNFGPTPLLTSYSNFRAPADFVNAERREGDLVVSNRYQFYFFYARREPDIALRPSGSRNRNALAPYMSRTKEVRCDDFERLLRRRRKGTVWLAINADAKMEQCLRKLAEKHPLELVYRDALDPDARVYRVQKRSSS